MSTNLSVETLRNTVFHLLFLHEFYCTNLALGCFGYHFREFDWRKVCSKRQRLQAAEECIEGAWAPAMRSAPCHSRQVLLQRELPGFSVAAIG